MTKIIYNFSLGINIMKILAASVLSSIFLLYVTILKQEGFDIGEIVCDCLLIKFSGKYCLFKLIL